MTPGRSVIVKRLSERMDRDHAQGLVRELRPLLGDDRPCLVFDFSDVTYLDSAAIEMVLNCMEEVMKRNGDLKFAAISPAVAAILKLTRVDCLFEIFEDVTDAVESFHRFPAYVFPRAWENTPSIVPGNGDPDTRRIRVRRDNENPS
jgi:anti-sigma B factor antagonist